MSDSHRQLSLFELLPLEIIWTIIDFVPEAVRNLLMVTINFFDFSHSFSESRSFQHRIMDNKLINSTIENLFQTSPTLKDRVERYARLAARIQLIDRLRMHGAYKQVRTGKKKSLIFHRTKEYIIFY